MPQWLFWVLFCEPFGHANDCRVTNGDGFGAEVEDDLRFAADDDRYIDRADVARRTGSGEGYGCIGLAVHGDLRIDDLVRRVGEGQLQHGFLAVAAAQGEDVVCRAGDLRRAGLFHAHDRQLIHRRRLVRCVSGGVEQTDFHRRGGCREGQLALEVLLAVADCRAHAVLACFAGEEVSSRAC